MKRIIKRIYSATLKFADYMNLFKKRKREFILSILYNVGIGTYIDITEELEIMFTQKEYPYGGLFNQNQAIERFLESMKQDNFIDYHGSLANKMFVDLNPESNNKIYDYKACLKKDGFEFIFKIKDRNRTVISNMIALASLLVAILALLKGCVEQPKSQQPTKSTRIYIDLSHHDKHK